MQTHYFQRYHSKENVDTANTTLLLSRLYLYSPRKFFAFLNQVICESVQDFDVELKFLLQEKSTDSVLDASIAQESFKIAVETKLYNNFSVNQLKRHLHALCGYKYQILITLDPDNISHDLQNNITSSVQNFNIEHNCNIVHIHLTFKDVVEKIHLVLDEQRDLEMLDILNDYAQYCNDSGLISDSWKMMRMVLAGTTFDDNVKNRLYYHNRNKGYSAHKYIGLYKNKTVSMIGEVVAIVDSIFDDNNKLHLQVVQGELTDDIKKRIQQAIEDSKNYGYALSKDEHRFFIVDEFHETDFKKVSPRAPMGYRYFDLCNILGRSVLPDKVEKIAELLKNKTWI